MNVSMRKYFIYDGHSKKGPFSFEELKTHQISKETPVWHEDLQEWTKAGELEELNDFFIQKIMPPPLPKALEINIKKRDEILNSFPEAEEIYQESKGRSMGLPIFIIIIILAVILFALYWFKIL